MSTMTCPNHEELQAYSLGLLSDAASEEVSAHLASCAECKAGLPTLDGAEDTFLTLLREPAIADPYLEESQCQVAVARACDVVRATPDSHTNLLRPKALGEYQLLEQLGRGGMGTVYKALQTKLDRMVALKVLPHNRVGDQKAIDRFEREMKAVGRLAHPNIVQAHDAREIDNTPVLVMEFIDGLDLAEIVRAVGAVPLAESCELIRQTALALQCAHEHGLVHRDIKPSNIMLARSGEVKLLDLGLARFFNERGGAAPAGEEMTITGQAMGTADYMAPEQASDSRTVDIRADLYSLGCTLYKLLSGRAPFSGPEYRTALDKMNAHVQRPAPPVRQLVPAAPVELVVLLDRILAKDPDDRPVTPAEVATALAPWCAGADLPALLARAEEAAALSLTDRCPLPGEHRTAGNVSPSNQAQSVAPLSSGRKSWGWKRPIGQLVAMAMIGGLGFALGIMIRIHKDGEVTSIELPGGATAHLSGSGLLDVELSSHAADAAGVTVLRTFSTADAPISKEAAKTDGGWSANCENRAVTQPIRLFEVSQPDIDNCTVVYRAKLRTEGLKGQAYLEMWCRFPGQGEFFSKGLDHAVSGTTGWSSYETPFFLKKGEKPDRIRLDVAVEGSGRVEIKDVELIKMPLPAGAEPVAEPGPQAPPSVSVAQPIVREVTDYLDFTGVIEAAQTAEIRARVTGNLEVHVKPGMSVKRGDLLMEVDRRAYQAEADQASNGVRRAKAHLDLQTVNLKRIEELVKSGVSSQQELLKAENQREEAVAALQVAEAALNAALLRLDYARIVAPFAGRISGPVLDGGNLVTADKTALATISSTDTMHVVFNMDERSWLAIRGKATDKSDPFLSLPVLCELPDDKGFVYHAKMDSVESRVDPTTGTVRCRAVLQNKEGIFMPGMFVRVRLLTSPPHKALLVPHSAVSTDQSQPYVFVVNEQNVAERRAVKIGQLNEGLQVVTEGLMPDDWIVTFVLQVRPGMAVAPDRAGTPRPSSSQTKQATGPRP